MAQLTIAEAIREAIREEMRLDESVFCLGEDIGISGGWGGAFTVTLGLSEEFGHERILDTPISEIMIAGACVGAAMTGMRPIGDVQYGDFLMLMMDQIVNEGAKMRYMSGGQVSVPMVMRAPVGATTRGAQHAQSLEGFFTHIPGIKVVCPSNAYDAKGLMKQAIRDNNPVIFFEHKLLYGNSGNRIEEGSLNPVCEVPDHEYLIEFGKASIKREGKDVTIVSNLLMLYESLKAAQKLEEEGISVEVIDPRTLVPFDYETVLKSVKKTSHLVIVHEDTKSNGWGAELSAYVSEHAIEYLDGPIKRVCTPDIPIPFSPILEEHVIPSSDEIVETVRKLVKK